MFERFTENNRRALVRASEEVRRLKHAYLGTDHLLLGLLATPPSNALRMLAALDVSAAQLAGWIEEAAPPGEQAPGGHIPFTPGAKKALELGFSQAESLGDAHVGTEHVLLGLIEEGEGVAVQVLAGAGLDRDAVLRVMPPGPRVDAAKWEVTADEATG